MLTRVNAGGKVIEILYTGLGALVSFEIRTKRTIVPGLPTAERSAHLRRGGGACQPLVPLRSLAAIRSEIMPAARWYIRRHAAGHQPAGLRPSAGASRRRLLVLLVFDRPVMCTVYRASGIFRGTSGLRGMSDIGSWQLAR
jgi:hypothetical protein